jgi:hypothetical protein
MAENPFDTEVMKTFMRDTARRMGVDSHQMPKIEVYEGGLQVEAIGNVNNVDGEIGVALFGLPTPQTIRIPSSLVDMLQQTHSIREFATYVIARSALTEEQLQPLLEISQAEAEGRGSIAEGAKTGAAICGGLALGAGVERATREGGNQWLFTGEGVQARYVRIKNGGNDIELTEPKKYDRRAVLAGGATWAAAGGLQGGFFGIFGDASYGRTAQLVRKSQAYALYAEPPELLSEARDRYNLMWRGIQHWLDSEQFVQRSRDVNGIAGSYAASNIVSMAEIAGDAALHVSPEPSERTLQRQ